MVLIDEHVFVIIMPRVKTGRIDEDAFTNRLLGVGLLCDFVLLPILHDNHYFMIAAGWKLGNITYYNSFGVQDVNSREYEKWVVSVTIMVIEIYFFIIELPLIFGK